MIAPLVMPISSTWMTCSNHCIVVVAGAPPWWCWRAILTDFFRGGAHRCVEPTHARAPHTETLLGRRQDGGVGVVEGAVFDLAAAHGRQSGVTRVAKAPLTQHAVVILGSEDGIAYGAAALRGVVLGARAARGLDRLQHNLRRLVGIGGVGFWLRVELLLVALVPLRTLASQLAGRHATEGDVRAFRGLPGGVDECLFVDAIGTHQAHVLPERVTQVLP